MHFTFNIRLTEMMSIMDCTRFC